VELTSLLEQRWREIFSRLEAGDVVPPTLQLRAEGLMEAAVVTGLATEQEVLEQMGDVYRDLRGGSIGQHLGDDWQHIYPFPQIPAVALRAPVYPSTPD
jgi:hypothetical protein